MIGKWRVWQVVLVVLVAATAWPARLIWDSYDLNSIAHISTRQDLAVLGASIYEFHSQAGRWPQQADDLATTAYALRRPNIWRASLVPYVIVWRNDLTENPRDNAGIVLAYHNAGLIAKLGRQWVVWGDLHTDYVKTGELRSALAAQNH